MRNSFLKWLILVLVFTGTGKLLSAQTYRLYQTARSNGSLRELDVNTGAVLATNVGGIVDGKGMAFSPVGDLFIANGSQVSGLSNPLGTAVPVASYAGETPYDVAFDSACNMYVVTNLNVYKYNPSFAQTLVFAHGLSSTGGDGNGNKGWGISIRPDNGEVYVIGNQGLRRFDPNSGLQVGGTLSGAPFGFAGIAFTSSGFNGAFLYLGYVISGVDQIRVYDTNLNFLRSFFASHNGNPIDLEVHPVTLDIYLFNTVTTNPTNSFSANEVLRAGWSTAANASRGSAIGFFSGAKLERPRLELSGRRVGTAVELHGVIDAGGESRQWKLLRRSAEREEMIGMGQVEGAELRVWDGDPEPGQLTYELSLWNEYGGEENRAEFVMEGEETAAPVQCLYLAGEHALELSGMSGPWTSVRLELMDMQGRNLFSWAEPGLKERIPLPDLAPGIYMLELVATGKTGEFTSLRKKFWIP